MALSNFQGFLPVSYVTEFIVQIILQYRTPKANRETKVCWPFHVTWSSSPHAFAHFILYVMNANFLLLFNFPPHYKP